MPTPEQFINELHLRLTQKEISLEKAIAETEKEVKSNPLSETLYIFYASLKIMSGNRDDIAADREHLRRLAERQRHAPSLYNGYRSYCGFYRHRGHRR